MRNLARTGRALARVVRGSSDWIRRSWIRVTNPDVRFGEGVRLGTGVIVRASDGGSIAVGAGSAVSRGAEVVAQRGSISIGSRTFIGPWTTITAKRGIEIGNDCLIAERVTIRDQNHTVHGAVGVPINEAGYDSGAIRIGDDVWIGAGAVILLGVSIGRGAVVASNAVVNRNVREYEVVGGVPARMIGHRKLKSS